MTDAISSTTAGASSSSGAATASRADLDMNAFLVMFTTQLQNQDPTNPLQAHELAAQLAQFTSVQKLAELNTNVQAQTELLASLHHGQMLSLLAKTVTAVSNTVKITDGEASPAGFSLPTDAQVTATILGSDGAVVRTLPLGAQTAGNHEIGWDGRDENGEVLPDGTYTVRLSAVDADGKAVTAASRVSGVVRSVRFDSGTPVLILDSGAEVSIGTVSEVKA